jgi:hypothetical protein
VLAERSGPQSVTTPDIARAKNILCGQHETPEALLELAERLKNESYFGYASKLLSLIEIDAMDPVWKRVKQQAALCTYKDQDLPSDERLERALDILRTSEDLNGTIDREKLGLTGVSTSGCGRKMASV